MEVAGSFRETQWRRGASLAGLVLLLFYWAGGYFSKTIQSYLPSPVILPLLLLLLHYLFIRFPFAMRVPGSPRLIRWPGLKRFLIELSIAVFFTVALLVFSAVALSWVRDAFPQSTGIDFTEQIVGSYYRSHAATVALIVFIFLFGPITEEVFFRGFLQNDFERRIPALPAALLQSTFFGMIHPYGFVQNFVLVFIGLTLTAIYKWRGRLLTPILTHCLFNFIVAGSALFIALEAQNGAYLGVVWDSQSEECIVRAVAADSPAFRAGIQPGDRIESIAGSKIERPSDVRQILFLHEPGEQVSVALIRRNEPLTLTVELGRRGAPGAGTTRDASTRESAVRSAPSPAAR